MEPDQRITMVQLVSELEAILGYNILPNTLGKKRMSTFTQYLLPHNPSLLLIVPPPVLLTSVLLVGR